MKSLWHNFWTFSGAILAVLATLFFISFQILEVVTPYDNPYMGIWTFLILPFILVIGLILIPAGYIKERRKRRKLYPDITDWPRFPLLDPNNRVHLRGLVIFGLGSLIVLPLIGVASYEGYHFTDSTQFCGQVCHSVMSPEYTAYLNSPHARVACAACHIGPGASWYVKAKISGVRQVIAVALKTYSRPIPTPVQNLRPARETCEQCHWPAKFYASQLRSRVHFASDERNSRSEIEVLLKTGGGDSSMGPPSGIHWHMALSQSIEYVATDEARQVIPWVRTTDTQGKTTVYRSDGKSSQDPPPAGELRTLDCMDCHNRPTHNILPPDRSVNTSLETGRLNPAIPYIKKVAVEALTLPYMSDEEADRGIDTYIRDFYGKPGSEGEVSESVLAQTVREVQAIYHRSFFPSMKVDWRSYPDNIGHMMFEGCFRCHDGEHRSETGHVVSRDCTSCHQFLEQAGVEAPQDYRHGVPNHPIELQGKHAQLNCSSCHTGGRAPESTCAGCHTTQSRFRQGISPELPGLTGTPPSYMAELDCESCHNLNNPQTAENIAIQCEGCHDKGYGELIQGWKQDAQAGRARAEAAIEELKVKLSGSGPSDPAQEELATRLQQALSQVDRAGAQHNLDFADAVYQRIVSLAAGDSVPNRK